jgi:hypothetical protein
MPVASQRGSFAAVGVWVLRVVAYLATTERPGVALCLSSPYSGCVAPDADFCEAASDRLQANYLRIFRDEIDVGQNQIEADPNPSAATGSHC